MCTLRPNFFDLSADYSSIIAVPAIGADARKTWTPADDSISWLETLQRKLPLANIILYDHLGPEERRLELRDPKDPNSKTVARELASVEASLAEYGVDKYADRLVGVLQQYRFSGVRAQCRTRFGAKCGLNVDPRWNKDHSSSYATVQEASLSSR